MIRNDPIFKPLAVERNLNKTAPVRIPGIRGLLRKIYLKIRSKNSDLYHFYVKVVMSGQVALGYVPSIGIDHGLRIII